MMVVSHASVCAALWSDASDEGFGLLRFPHWCECFQRDFPDVGVTIAATSQAAFVLTFEQSRVIEAIGHTCSPYTLMLLATTIQRGYYHITILMVYGTRTQTRQQMWLDTRPKFTIV